MEGLPVRQWRKQPAVLNNAPQKETQAQANQQDTIWRELPMPKGSELYPVHSQALLRAARAGRILQRTLQNNDEDKDGPDDGEEAEGEQDTSFVVQRWAQLPKEAEEPEPEYLAKRRKGLPMLYGGMGESGATVPMRKCKIKKIDADGNPYLLDVLIPEGAVIEGEVEEGEEVTTRAPAPGTVIEGIGIANADGVIVANEQVMPTPPRRRPPPPKRKPKGPGRGRKKKVIIEGALDGTPTAVAVGTSAAGVSTGTTSKLEVNGANGDTGITDESAIHEGEDGSEDEDDEGDEGDDVDREEGELSDEDVSRSASPMKPLPGPKAPVQADQLSKIITEVELKPEAPTASEVATTIPDSLPSLVDNKSDIPGSSEIPISGSIGSDTNVAAVAAPDPLPASIQIDASNPISASDGLSTSGTKEVTIAESIPSLTVIPPQEPPATESVIIADIPSKPALVIDAVIPEAHDSLEGLKEPITTEESKPQGDGLMPQEKEINTSDTSRETTVAVPTTLTGDDDIFGSLERHLDGKS
jgi:hypothetical protein